MKKMFLCLLMFTVFLSGCSSSQGNTSAENSSQAVLQGDSSQGDTSTGDTLQGDTSQGDTLQGDTSRGDTLQGNTTQGDTSTGDASQHPIGEVTVLAQCLSNDADGYTLTLPDSQTTFKLTSEKALYAPYITDELVTKAEEQIATQLTEHSNNSGFYIEIYEDYLCLSAEVIVYFDEPQEGLGCSDHDHIFYREKISTHGISGDDRGEILKPHDEKFKSIMIMDMHSKEYDYNKSYFPVTIPELDGAVVDYDDQKGQLFLNGEHLAGGVASGCVSFYLADLTKDGKPELCFGRDFGSGIVDYRIEIFDYTTKQIIFSLAKRSQYDYTLFLKNGDLYVKETEYMTLNETRTGRLDFDGNEIFIRWDDKITTPPVNETEFAKSPLKIQSNNTSICPFTSLVWSRVENEDGSFTEMQTDRIDVISLLKGEASSFNPEKEIPKIVLDGKIEYSLHPNGKITKLYVITPDWIRLDTTFDALSVLNDGAYFVVAEVFVEMENEKELMESYRCETIFHLVVPVKPKEVAAFSYTEALETYKEGTPGVKYEGFENIEESPVRNVGEAIERAKKECTIEWNATKVYFDEYNKVWMVMFYTEGVLGGCQDVYMGADGKTLLIVYGE